MDALKVIGRTLLTSFSAMALVIFLLGFLPDYATFDGGSELGKEVINTLPSESFWQKNKNFWKQILFNDGGRSRVHKDRSVGEILRRDGMISFYFFSLSLLLSTVLGFFLGLISGIYYNKDFEKILRGLGVLVIATPSFLLAPGLIYFFSLRYHLLPAALWEGPSSLVLPILTLSARPIFFLARLFGEQLHEVAQAEFITTAMAKGVNPFDIWFFHIIPNSLTAFIVAVGNLFGQLISGTFLVETLFALPGLGFLLVQTLTERDYPVFLALVLVFSLVLQLGHRFSEWAMERYGEIKFLKFKTWQSRES